MLLTPTLRTPLALAGVLILAVVGLIGWTQHDEPGAPAVPAQANYLTPQMGNPEPVSRDPTAHVVYAPSPFGEETHVGSADRAYNAPDSVQAAYAAISYAERTAMPAPVMTERRYCRTSRRHRRYMVIRKRRFTHSAAIVGGCAAGGALIGALTGGGGKGAAIGALAGGGAGLVYDRMTNKKRLVSEP
jgi:hypothetical protein